MGKHLELWQFIHGRLVRSENVVLLVVAASSGSSPGRAGYKMAVAANGELCGSIGGGVMEMNMVSESWRMLAEGSTASGIRQQVHRKDADNASGMICSGRQTVIFKVLTPEVTEDIDALIYFLQSDYWPLLCLEREKFAVGIPECPTEDRYFRRYPGNNFAYSERLGAKTQLYIIGGGHCALALSELMSKLDFRITIFDDRHDVNTIQKNCFADDISIIEDYAAVHEGIPDWEDVYIVVMTVGYASDKVVIKHLNDRDFKYFGVLGSKAKMATLMKELRQEGILDERLARIRTPIGLPINSCTPEEIAVSIAAEIISVKNAKK